MDDLTRRHPKPNRLVVMALVTLTFAALLTFVSVGGTGDTPCGPLLDRNFGWASFNQCGITYSGTTGVIVLLVAVAVALGVMARTAPGDEARARAVLVLAAAVVAGAWAAFTWTASVYPEPVVRRGWVTVRNLTGLTTLYLAVLVGFVGVSHRPSKAQNR